MQNAQKQQPGVDASLSQTGSPRGVTLSFAQAAFAAGAAWRLPWFGKRIKRSVPSHAGAPIRAALEVVPVALIGIDKRGAIAFVNEKASALFGYRSEELIGASASLLIPEWSARDASAAPLEPVPQPDRTTAHTMQTLIARRRDGTEFPAELSTSHCRVDGVATQFTAIVERSERYELQRNRQELAHLTRISALGELAGSLAHELNQPLTAILSNSQAAQRFLEAEPINVPEVRETLKDIVADNCRAGEIIRKMRALVRKGDVEWQSVDVGSVVRDVALLVHSDAIVRGIRTTLNVAADLPVVRGDKVQLQQVLLNLLLNAFDAVQDRAPADRVVAVHVALERDAMVRIAVRDRGQGLTVDQLDKIFKPFFTSKPHGLGLGLSISRNIVAAHGGRLWAENNADRGASFYVTLPSQRTAGLNRACREP